MNSTIPPLTDEWIPHASTETTLSASLQNSSEILPCATGDNDIPTYKDISTIPFYKILSRGMVACWYSHLQVLRKLALSLSTTVAYDDDWDGREGVAIVFEDDIDVESDIERRLKDMWSDLPKDWDMLFLGHCWSDESVNPPVSPSSPIHLSNAPKCTHAYAVSPRGAHRLLLHLTYPPFAFSRALDQAFAHLIRSGRINAYSVVPSIVIQRKERNDSDIWATSEGSTWRETLQHSAFEAMGNNSVLL
ncbi:hypothetical protein SCHPADRAFT_821194 [Schizopora paradoxa]|uniref:Glycosyltransferase family 25 protein n=1 Tax=Schizopora paradoxa TaxID=27342 RepID=A0A0H2RZN2_9AGAM|nr:hypothetical protein SCHPADRAFT_821194 [Schizopora paradoxa]